MKPNITRHIFASALAVIFLFTVATGRGQNTIYVWSSLDGDPGGISGTIVLSSPSYSGDFDPSRIVSVTLSSTVSGTYNVTLPADIYAWGSIMTWGPTGISEMVLGLSRGQPNPSWFLIADQNNLYGFNPYCPAKIREYSQGPLIAGDDLGAWVAYVPEPASIWLFVSALTFGILYRVCRTGPKRPQSGR
jgi:hypothetical protein